MLLTRSLNDVFQMVAGTTRTCCTSYIARSICQVCPIRVPSSSNSEPSSGLSIDASFSFKYAQACCIISTGKLIKKKNLYERPTCADLDKLLTIFSLPLL